MTCPLAFSDVNADSARAASTESTQSTQPDWAEQIVDVIDSVVSNVRSKTTDPVRRIGEFVLLGVMLVGLALVAFFLLLIGVFKVFVALSGDRVWLVYLILGGISFIAGILLWPRRRTA